jgi:hypothetical protein
VSDLFLGVIAVAVLTMALIQVTAIVVAVRAARRVGDAVNRFEADVKPIVTNLKAMSADAARTASIASAQAQRAEQLINDVTARVTDTVAAVESTILKPAREAYAMVQGLLGAMSVFRPGPPAAGPRAGTTEEEDPLFIG